MTQLTTEKLSDLLSKRLRCLQQLRDLGLKQAELISQGEMSPLLRLLGAKNQLIVAVQAIEHELTPFHSQDPDKRQWPSAEERTRCSEQAAQCQQLLAEVMQLEEQNEMEMTLRRDRVANQLQAAQAASTARSAYQAQQSIPPKPRSTSSAFHAPGPHFATDGERPTLDLHSEV
ncbi:MAG: flagellar export chaperone FlgN [Planctomycetales bacterium]|nr:flagellar export chaperone FlgN [Planctomycetales bacterium]